MHLSNNQIDEKTMTDFKWQLSIGIDVETYRDENREMEEFNLLPAKQEPDEDKSPELKKSKTKIKAPKIVNPYTFEKLIDMKPEERQEKFRKELQAELIHEKQYAAHQD